MAVLVRIGLIIAPSSADVQGKDQEVPVTGDVRRREFGEEIREESMNKQKGFSLIELLIVVAIILIIAAIAVPNLLRSKMAANESSAAASERTIATSNVTYSTTYGIGYAQTFSYLGPDTSVTPPVATSTAADLIDSTLMTGTKSGYDFSTYSANDSNGDGIFETFTSFSSPVLEDSTGKSVFCVDQTNVVLKDAGGTASTAGPGSAGIGCAGGNFKPLGN
jgi:type IV pilus assembly protein PilA